jgi:hypothetical protein
MPTLIQDASWAPRGTDTLPLDMANFDEYEYESRGTPPVVHDLPLRGPEADRRYKVEQNSLSSFETTASTVGYRFDEDRVDPDFEGIRLDNFRRDRIHYKDRYEDRYEEDLDGDDVGADFRFEYMERRNSPEYMERVRSHIPERAERIRSHIPERAERVERRNLPGPGQINVTHSGPDWISMSTIEDIYQTYLTSSANSQNDGGVTIMLRDIPYRLQVEPDLFRILHKTTNLEHIDYVYLPMTIEGVSKYSNVQPRNKGYCFVHFSVEATARLFASRIQEYMIPDTGKVMFASRAKFQGLSMNLINLLDIQSKKWRPKHGVAHIRASTGALVSVDLLPLRNLYKKRSVRGGFRGQFLPASSVRK